MQCDYHNRGLCHSCTLIDQPYALQLATKAAGVREVLSQAGSDTGALQWLEPVASAESGFRNKAKMVVAGSVQEPTLGILDPRGRGVDLRACPLYLEVVGQALEQVARFSAELRLLPYNVTKARGELKHVLLTVSAGSELMLRFVLRSQRQVQRIRENLPTLQAALPSLSVVSVNLQREHKAVLEGPEELVLTEQDSLLMQVNHVPLRLRSRSFFQTNTEVAAALYRRAADWAEQINPSRVLDLYCGVGGFALHMVGPSRSVLGVEVSAEAVRGAREAVAHMGLGPESVQFHAGDATAWQQQLGSASSPGAYDDGGAADLVVVNPPRRGLGAELAHRLDECAAQDLIYSSCNARSLARDLANMPSWRPVEGQVLDMFPHTTHYEVALLLQRG
ncbi:MULTISPECIES: methyltransferase domain-containing protein [Kocuria]|uniref:Methyltransferase domain-containing protein n=1 Tax=Kocuria subflava TaxID=1736139 RepID=A0A846TPY2_9MICC|nr:methyltransferase domain-containing protein [Kocuria sp. CPCC 104605]NKE10503.1 methyltransferase domain-containing protein [Kocuria subflava]